MKKIILGTIIISTSPFITLLGGYILNNLKVQEGAFIFASILGGLSVIINYFIAVLMIAQGHKENQTLNKL